MVDSAFLCLNEFAIAEAPFEATPITLIFRPSALVATPIPEISPPPPTGTTIASKSGSSSIISKATVPCPDITLSSVKGCTKSF